MARLSPPDRDPVEALCALDLTGRGISRLVVPGDMAGAARSLLGAARAILVTGFVPRAGWGAETDGPSGAVILGRALRRLGVTIRYLADSPVSPLLHACLRTLREPRDVLLVPGPARTALEAARSAVSAFGPTHLVAVERPGRAADGGYYNARGGPIPTANAPLDGLFLRPPPRVTTVGIGDGGNEVGMGRVRARVTRDVPHGARIGSVVRTHHLIVAGTSNWGAWGLVAHLGLGTGRDLLHTPDEEGRLTRAMVAAGGVDGLTGARQPTVDALPLALHQTMLRTLREMTGYLMARRGVVPRAGRQETA